MRPNYKRAIQELSVILKAARKRRGISLKSSETTKGVQDITQESSEIAYQFTDHDLLVIKDTSKGDKDEK